MTLRRALLAAALLLCVPSARGDADVSALFHQGRIELQIGAGYGVFDDRSYGVALVGASYYMKG